jgi:RNA polymerase sigma factor (sigma-70 family)
MPELNDHELLTEFARTESETAFATLVARYVNLVYSTALRFTGNPHHAEEITQAVFIMLARKAGKLSPRIVLSGWLYQAARLTAANLVKGEIRRHHREQEAYMQTILNEPDATAWKQIAPLLDDAMGGLGETDRNALVLRFFENKTAAEVAAALKLTEAAAHKRVNRALEKLRKFFAKRGVSSTTAIIAGTISANSVQAAPAGLAAIISATALSGTTITTAAVLAVTKAIAMTTLQKAIVTTALVATVGAGVFEAHQNSQLRQQNQTLRQQQTPLAAQLSQLATENNRLSNLVDQAKDQKSLSEAQFNELLKLRGQAGQARTAVQQLAKLRTATAQPTTMPAYFTNAMAQGFAMAEKFKKKAALAKLARMKEKLNLNDNQEQAISDIMMKDIEASSQQSMQKSLMAMSGKQVPEENQATPQNLANEEAEIKAVLTPEQLSGYPDFQQSEAMVAADDSAKADLTLMTGEMDLTPDQQNQVHAALYQYNLNNPSQIVADAVAQARANGKITDVMNLYMQAQKETLEGKLKILNGILTPEQLQTYQQKQADMIDMQASAMKMFLPQTNNPVAQ